MRKILERYKRRGEFIIEYYEFIEAIRLELEGKLQEGEEVVQTNIVKNNSVELEGLCIMHKDVSITPNIYMNGYYKRFLEGECKEELVNEIKQIYDMHCLNGENTYHEFIFSLEAMESRIIYRLINCERNESLLDEVPHIRFLDLAIIFCCLVKEDNEGIGTVRISNQTMNEWNMDTRQLFQRANENTPVLFPPVLKDLEEIINYSSDITMEEYDNIGMGLNLPCPMYVLTNQKGINGASALLYHGYIEKLTETLDSDLYILPSSIHELILIPYSPYLIKENLLAMVNDVNRTHVPQEEYLSDQVYLYKRSTKSFEMFLSMD